MIAKTLITKHNLTQVEAAKLLGISQPAISLYERKIRGKAFLEKLFSFSKQYFVNDFQYSYSNH
ncbi:MAG: helix-turn-helix domain-containing protein [Candidatus Bathyarchaeia archaeon]